MTCSPNHTDLANSWNKLCVNIELVVDILKEYAELFLSAIQHSLSNHLLWLSQDLIKTAWVGTLSQTLYLPKSRRKMWIKCILDRGPWRSYFVNLSQQSVLSQRWLFSGIITGKIRLKSDLLSINSRIQTTLFPLNWKCLTSLVQFINFSFANNCKLGNFLFLFEKNGFQKENSYWWAL